MTRHCEAIRLATLDWYGMQTGRKGDGNSGHVLSKYAVLGKSQALGGTCLGAGAMASIIRGLLDGLEPEAAANRALDLARGWREAGETAGAVEGALALAERADAGRTRAVARLGEGWVGEEAVAIGLYAVLVGGDFCDAVRTASNHGGDSDSTASIAGQIYGAWKGKGEIPEGWARRLDVLEPLLDVAERRTDALASTATSPSEATIRRRCDWLLR